MSTQNTDVLFDQKRNCDNSITPTNGDGVYKIRIANHLEKVIQMRADLSGEWRRFTSEDGKHVVFEKV